jgi:hypothetical protein
MTLYETTAFEKKLGIVRLEVWREGLVLYVGGIIVWRSWFNLPNE